jgi:hypothetical protein
MQQKIMPPLSISASVGSSTTPSGGAAVIWPGPLSMSISNGTCNSSLTLSASLHAQPHTPHGIDDPVKGRAGRKNFLVEP